MVRQARAMVRAGVIGSIRQLHVQYVQGYLASEDVPPGWRLDPARIGGSMILIDIGTHAHHLAGYVSGLDLESVCADVGHVVPGRKVDDYASLLLRYSTAHVAQCGSRTRPAALNTDYASEFSARWAVSNGIRGTQPISLQLPERGVRGARHGRKDSLVSEAARQVTRVEIGHPEGYLEAFANLYSDFARAIVQR